MLSKRSGFPRRPNRWSVLREAVLRQGRMLLDLTESNPTAVGIAYPEARIREALGRPGVARYDPLPLGLPSARQTIAARYAAAGTPVDASRVVVTASTSESYGFLFKLLADPGDAVMVPAPGYPLFDFLGRLESVDPVSYPLDPADGWSLDSEALAAAAPDGTRAVMVVNPGNPTGRFLSRAERDRTNLLCRERGWALISDEVFSGYAREPDPRRVTCAAHSAEVLTFSLGGLSKAAGMPQMKLGWIIVGGPDDEIPAAMERLEIIADSFLSVSTPVQLALADLLEIGDEMRPLIAERVEANRRRFETWTEGSPCRILPAEGGWYGVLQLPATRTGEDWALLLLEREDLLVHPGYLYDFPREAYVVVSLLPSPEVVEEAAARLTRRVRAEV